MTKLETCPGCQAVLPTIENGATHRYMTSSAACWAIFNSLHDPERPLAPAPFNNLIVDAYAVQHPGTQSDQTINSVAIHAMVLYGILERGFEPSQALWLRQRPGRIKSTNKHLRFHWLTPPSFDSSLSVADVAVGKTSLERSELVELWVKDVWLRWSEAHGQQIGIWFERYVISERI
jgi:Family of unknown function (DUF5946)